MSTPIVSDEEQAQAFLAWKREEAVEFWTGEEWLLTRTDYLSLTPRTIIRRKPAPKWRAWKAEEVPVGALTRTRKDVNPNNPSRQIIDGENGVVAFLCGCPYQMEALLRNREHSIDGGKTWHPCGVLEDPA